MKGAVVELSLVGEAGVPCYGRAKPRQAIPIKVIPAE